MKAQDRMFGNYDPQKVGGVLLVVIIEQHPALLTVDQLALRVVSDPNDEEEVKAFGEALRSMSASGLIQCRGEDKTVEPTPAALHAHDLLTGVC
jgi:hypothetical protein